MWFDEFCKEMMDMVVLSEIKRLFAEEKNITLTDWLMISNDHLEFTAIISSDEIFTEKSIELLKKYEHARYYIRIHPRLKTFRLL